MHFTRRGTQVTTVVLHPSNVRGNSPAIMELAGVDVKETLAGIVSGDSQVVRVEGVKRRKGSTTVEFQLRVLGLGKAGTSISVSATTGSKARLDLAVKIEAAIALPDRNTVPGAVARLLMAEARGPSHGSYSAADSRTSMEWMRRVLENRLANNPAQFLAPGAKNLIDIIKAPGQFGGFSGYPSYDSATRDRLQQMLDIANNDNDQRQSVYRQFIQNAIDVAQAKEAVTDPSETGLYAWRTEGSGSPGSGFKEFRSLGGNTFYTLSKP